MRWSPILAKALSDKNTNIDINASTKSLVWQPIKLGEVITEANFIPLSDLEDVETITFNGRMKGKTTVESGKGKDVIEVNRQSGKDKLILEDLNKKIPSLSVTRHSPLTILMMHPNSSSSPTLDRFDSSPKDLSLLRGLFLCSTTS